MEHYNYKLTITNTPYFYSGHAKDYEKSTRIQLHKSDCYKPSGIDKKGDIKLYKKIRELDITKQDFYDRVKLTKIITGMSKEQAITAENSLIDLSNPYCLNSRRECMDRNMPKYMKDYREEHKEEIKIDMARRYQNEKEERLKSAKEYRDNNKDKVNAKVKCDNCGLVVYKRGLNPRHITGKYCINYNVNKDTWIKCECGLIVKDRLERHKQTKKHKEQMQLLSPR